MSGYGFHNFKLSFCERNPMQSFFLLDELITNCEMPSSNRLQKACSGFLIAACVPKSSSVTRL
jgi:hypothetical protein